MFHWNKGGGYVLPILPLFSGEVKIIGAHYDI